VAETTYGYKVNGGRNGDQVTKLQTAEKDGPCVPGCGRGAGIALIVSLFGSQFALADASDTAVAPSIAGRPSSGDLEEITVTATRRAESQSKVPVAVTAFDSESLAARGITTETDLQQSVPGLTVKTTASQNQINYTIRGQTLDAFSGSSPGVLPYFNDVVVSSQTATAFYDLASVQVLKGLRVPCSAETRRAAQSFTRARKRAIRSAGILRSEWQLQSSRVSRCGKSPYRAWQGGSATRSGLH